MKMVYFFYFIFIIYLILVTVHLYSCFHSYEDIRRATKVFLMPVLGLTYYLGCPKEKFSKIILVALVFGCLGDTFLLIQNLFLFGVASFLIGHLLYIFKFYYETGIRNYKKNKFIFLLIFALYAFAEMKLMEYFKPALEKANLWGPLFVYSSILALLNVSSAIYAYCIANIYSILTYLGSLIFAISDCILAKQLFFGNHKYYQIAIMFTYILGQSLISLGMANTPNSLELDLIKKII